MKYLFPLIFVLIITYLSSCCSDSCEKPVSESDTIASVENAAEYHDEADHDAPLELNDGAKWKVNENMMVFIRNMEKDLHDFSQTPQKDYAALAKSMDMNIRELTSNCTMEGKAHDELHKWLVPFIELSEAFDVASDTTEQVRLENAFHEALVTFNQYFE